MGLAFYIEDAIKDYLEANYETQLWEDVEDDEYDDVLKEVTCHLIDGMDSEIEEVVRLYCETDIISKQMAGVISNAIRTTKKQT